MERQQTSQFSEWTLIFTDTNRDHWFIRRLKPGFRHVMALKKGPGGHVWTWVNPVMPICKIDVIDGDLTPEEIGGEGATVITIRHKFDVNQQRCTLCLINCVEVVKAVLGIKDFWCFTPHQLYKKVTKYD